jgi:hypothetical protein
MSDFFDYAEQVMEDALEEDAYYREKDREIEEAEAQQVDVRPGPGGMCTNCGRDAYLPGSMGGCYCV